MDETLDCPSVGNKLNHDWAAEQMVIGNCIKPNREILPQQMMFNNTHSIYWSFIPLFPDHKLFPFPHSICKLIVSHTHTQYCLSLYSSWPFQELSVKLYFSCWTVSWNQNCIYWSRFQNTSRFFQFNKKLCCLTKWLLSVEIWRKKPL